MQGGNQIPTFGYRGYTDGGQIESGTLDAPSEDAAFRTLSATGLSVVDLHHVGGIAEQPWYRRDILVLRAGMPLGAQAALAEEMATILQVRLTVPDMLRLLSEGADGAGARAQFIRVSRLVAEGAALSDALARAGPKVAPIFLALLRSGEASSALPEQLAELARLLRWQDQLRSQIATALIYPAILVAAAIVVVMIVALTLAPSLAPIFEAQGRPPPPVVATFLAVGTIATTQGAWLLVATALAVVGGLVAVRAIGTRVALAAPVLGRLKRDAALVTLLRSLSLLLKAGRPLADSLRAVAQFDRSGPFSESALAAASALEGGNRAHTALAADRRIPAIVSDLFRIGEEANTLVPVLESLAATQTDRLERRSRRFIQVLTPLLTLAVGGLVGALVYSILDAVFAINELSF